MRQIKFRAWDTINKKWITPDDNELVKVSFYDNFLVKHWTLELSQYTGLKDKNGKEIYEGDVLRIAETNSSRNGQLEIVKYDAEKSGFIPFCGYYYQGLPYLTVNPSEVIGNIYENPELTNKQNH